MKSLWKSNFLQLLASILVVMCSMGTVSSDHYAERFYRALRDNSLTRAQVLPTWQAFLRTGRLRVEYVNVKEMESGAASRTAGLVVPKLLTAEGLDEFNPDLEYTFIFLSGQNTLWKDIIFLMQGANKLGMFHPGITSRKIFVEIQLQSRSQPMKFEFQVQHHDEEYLNKKGERAEDPCNRKRQTLIHFSDGPLQGLSKYIDSCFAVDEEFGLHNEGEEFNEADLTTVATYMRNLEASFTSDDIAIGSIDVMTDVKKGPSVDPRFHGMDQFWLIVVMAEGALPIDRDLATYRSLHRLMERDDETLSRDTVSDFLRGITGRNPFVQFQALTVAKDFFNGNCKPKSDKPKDKLVMSYVGLYDFFMANNLPFVGKDGVAAQRIETFIYLYSTKFNLTGVDTEKMRKSGVTRPQRTPEFVSRDWIQSLRARTTKPPPLPLDSRERSASGRKRKKTKTS